MIERMIELSERMIAQAGVSRRGFLGWLGHAALGVAAAMTGLVTAAQAAPGGRGCSTNADCGAGQYCEKRGRCNGRGDCTPQPDFCIEVFDPVCGCNGRTYSNDCYAARDGVNVRHPGPCRR